MSPVIIGLLFAIPIGAYTAKPRMAALFATPEEVAPPAVLVRANELAALPPIDRGRALVDLRHDPSFLTQHLRSLPPPRRRRPEDIDAHLATACARIEASDTFEQAIASLSSRETLAVLNDRALLERVLKLA
jgi:membrane glycosyltransferase